MRTTKRYSLELNRAKWESVVKIAHLYRDEKNAHLKYYNTDKNYVEDKSNLDQQMRNVRAKYKSPHHLQARQWKIVQKDAYETVHKNWSALAVEIKSLIAQHKKMWTDTEMHYAYWLTYSPKRMAELVDSHCAPAPEHFEITYPEKKRVMNYLRRVIRRKRGDRPVAKLARSFVLDADMYSVGEKIVGDKKKLQILNVMGLVPHKRIAIPLTGYSNFSGNIRIILDHKKHRVEVHTHTEISEKRIPEEGEVIALDAGISEVFTDENGTAYGQAFGKTLVDISKRLLKTGRERNKLHALEKVSSKHKSHRIRKFNLGKMKLKDRKRNGQERVKQQISQAIHTVVDERKPAVVITENLDIRGKAKSKQMSRLVTSWMRSSLKERLNFLALVEGFHHKQVNPAYSSQMCPTCLFVHKDNRKGDLFQCLNCGHTDHSDRVAANNLLARHNDPDTTLYTPKAVVRSILQKRFIASLQSPTSNLEGASVSGRTDTHSKVCQSETPPSSKITSIKDAVRNVYP